MSLPFVRRGVVLLVAVLLTACGGGDELVPTTGQDAVDPLATAVAGPSDGAQAPPPAPAGPVAEAPPTSVLTAVAGFSAEDQVPGAGTVYSRTPGELPTLILAFLEDPGSVLDDEALAGLVNQIPLEGVQLGPSEEVGLGGLDGMAVTATANIASGQAADLRLYALTDPRGTWTLLLVAPAGDTAAMADLVTLAETFTPTAQQ